MIEETQKKEAYPLAWPPEWSRTRVQDRKPNSAWKKTANQYKEALEKELKRMECPAYLVSCNVQVNQRGTLAPGLEPLDVGVAVYFSRKEKEDFRWQDALGLQDPAPTEEQINSAYRKLAAIHHPDRGGDPALFDAATRHRNAAMKWINRKTTQDFAYVIACDQFNAVRLNLESIVLTIKAMRQIERCGATGLLERAFKGFSALPAYEGVHDVPASA